jgi:hypothetical protein
MVRDSGETSGGNAVRELVVSIFLFLERADKFQYLGLGDSKFSSRRLTPARMSRLFYFGLEMGGW